MNIQITVGDISLEACLDDNPTACRIAEALPLEARYSTWGDEIYFSIPVESDEEPDQVIMEVGDLAFWPPGNAFCIFYGRTPASTDDQPRAASEVIPLGKVTGDACILKGVRAPKIKLERIPDTTQEGE